MICVFSGVGLKETLKMKFVEAGAEIVDQDRIIDRMAAHIISSKSDSTVEKYNYQVKAFKSYCETKNLQCLPAYPIHVAMYLSSLIDKGKSDSVVSAAFYGIKWYHCVNDVEDPTESSIVKAMLESAKRLNSKPTQKKDVVTAKHLVELCDIYKEATDVIILRDLSMILVCYSGFLRFDEASNLRCCDVLFNADYVTLSIRKSKTDIYI